jgi:hypothetical protein
MVGDGARAGKVLVDLWEQHVVALVTTPEGLPIAA